MRLGDCIENPLTLRLSTRVGKYFPVMIKANTLITQLTWVKTTLIIIVDI